MFMGAVLVLMTVVVFTRKSGTNTQTIKTHHQMLTLTHYRFGGETGRTNNQTISSNIIHTTDTYWLVLLPMTVS